MGRNTCGRQVRELQGFGSAASQMVVEISSGACSRAVWYTIGTHLETASVAPDVCLSRCHCTASVHAPPRRKDAILPEVASAEKASGWRRIQLDEYRARQGPNSGTISSGTLQLMGQLCFLVWPEQIANGFLTTQRLSTVMLIACLFGPSVVAICVRRDPMSVGRWVVRGGPSDSPRTRVRSTAAS